MRWLKTIFELSGDEKYLDVTPGFISILHSWGSNLSYHPHLHVLSTSGGLDSERNWHRKDREFFLPGKVMAKLFRGKFMASLKALHDQGLLHYEGETGKYRNHYFYRELLEQCYGKDWVTDIRESFASAESVMHYLGRYTHRIAVSNGRILGIDDKSVTIRVKDYRQYGAWKEVSFSRVEFIRRFLMHIPPKKFVRIRH